MLYSCSPWSTCHVGKMMSQQDTHPTPPNRSFANVSKTWVITYKRASFLEGRFRPPVPITLFCPSVMVW